MLILPGLLSAAAAAQLTCSQCMTLQEGIFRALHHNVTALEKAALAGTSEVATLQVGQIIWHMCKEEPWKSRRYTERLEGACQAFTKEHVDLATNLWKEKSADEYKDPALAFRITRQLCTLPDIGACSLDELPDAYETISAKRECGLCEAMVGDLHRTVRASRDAGAKPKSDPYFRLVGLMTRVCDELPMRHSIRQEERTGVLEGCQDLWDEFEHKFVQMAVHTEESFARGICAQSELELCTMPMALEVLKDEL